MSDRGPDEVKSKIQDILDKFLDEDDTAPNPAETNPPKMTEPGDLAVSARVKN
jgi:hypothetical protein